MFWPMLRNVAVTPAELKIERILAVVAPGPSSNVSATVLPLPGAEEFTPYGAAGQPVDTCGETTRGGDATRPFGISAGGPAGPSCEGGGWAAAVACVRVADGSPALVRGADLLIVGGPTHMRGMSSGMTRKKGAEGEQKKAPDLHVEPDFDGPGLRDWFHGLDQPTRSSRAAAFDTRAGIRMAGGAAPGIARRLRRHGYRVLATEG
jgi:hypothetical protein